MATRIGVSNRHWQSPLKTSGSHYDLCMAKRRLAVKFGAVEITEREAAAMNARRRQTGELGEPTDAIEWFRNSRRLPLDQANNASQPLKAQDTLFPANEP